MSSILFSEEILRGKIVELGRRITADYADREIDLVCLINGASTFCADLVRHIGVPVRQHYLGFTSYPEIPKSGEVRITLDIAEPLQGRHVLVLEGIVVSGRTPKYIVEMLKLRQPASIALCALATKPAVLAVDLPVQYSAFQLTSEIAVGYGVGKGAERALPNLMNTAVSDDKG